jgi:hypothetical protein
VQTGLGAVCAGAEEWGGRPGETSMGERVVEQSKVTNMEEIHPGIKERNSARFQLTHA